MNRGLGKIALSSFISFESGYTSKMRAIFSSSVRFLMITTTVASCRAVSTRSAREIDDYTPVPIMASPSVLCDRPGVRGLKPETVIRSESPDASTSTRSDGLEFTVGLRRRELRSGEMLHFRFELINLSTATIYLTSPIFRGDDCVAEEWWMNIRGKRGIYLEVQDSNETTVALFPWKISNEDFSDLLIKRQKALFSEKYPVRELVRGARVSSVGWCSSASMEYGLCPPGNYVEAAFLQFARPGRYRMRGIYDPNPRVIADEASPPSNALVTPWISFQIVDPSDKRRSK